MRYLIVLTFMLFASFSFAQQNFNLKEELKQRKNPFSYSYGAVLGAEIKGLGLATSDAEKRLIVQGIDAYFAKAGDKSAEEAAQAVVSATITQLNNQKQAADDEQQMQNSVDLNNFYIHYGKVVAANWHLFGVKMQEIDLNDFEAGYSMGNDTQISFNTQEGQQYVTEFYKQKKNAALLLKQKENDAYFAALKSNKKMLFSEQGFAYQVLEKGKGVYAKSGDKLLLRYKGTLTDGTVFDQSPVDGSAMLVDFDGVMKGWQLLFPMLNKGSKVKVYFPAQLGYGTRKMPKVPANSILIYEFELVDVQ